jgi:hypothetical protein
VPEIGGGCFEFDWGVKTFGHGLGAANHFAGDALFGSGVFEHQARLERQALGQDQERSIVIDADGGGVESNGLALHGQVDIGAHAQEDALATATIVARDD